MSSIGETCAGCGKEIGMLDASYYVPAKRGADFGETFHLGCGIGRTERQLKEARELLDIALAEHDDHNGQFAADYMPEHWTHRARRLLTAGQRDV